MSPRNDSLVKTKYQDTDPLRLNENYAVIQLFGYLHSRKCAK